MPVSLYTASHGLGAVNQTAEIQHRYNGAICCQHHGDLTLDALFSADDVPYDRPYLEGAVFFQSDALMAEKATEANFWRLARHEYREWH